VCLCAGILKVVDCDVGGKGAAGRFYVGAVVDQCYVCGWQRAMRKRCFAEEVGAHGPVEELIPAEAFG